MSVLHHLPCNPATNTMHEHVQRIFASSGMRGLVELSWTSTRTPHKLEHGRLYDLADLDDLVEHAASLNASANCNVYISAGLRRAETPTLKRAGDSDVFATVAAWADFDKPAGLTSALDVAERLNLRPNVVVFTGNEPHLRGQMWWVLEEPCEDLALHRRLQSALAQRLGGDPSVVNPSRVMRLGGSVAWPLKAGRVLEMTGFYEVETRTAPYTIDEIEARLRQAGALEQAAPTAKVLDFSAAAPVLDLDDMVERARENGQWHKNALLATAHLLGRGTPPDVVLDVLAGRLQQPGFTYHDTRRELEIMVRGGVQRGMGANALREQLKASLAVTPAVEGEAKPQRDPFPLFSIEGMGDEPPPEWRVDGFIPKVGIGVLYGPSGTFKSFVALDLGLSIAHGLDWRGVHIESAPTVYIAAEGTYGIRKRIKVWREHRGGEAACAGFWLAPVAVNLQDAATVNLIAERLRALPQKPAFIVIDTLARTFGPGNENDAKDMSTFIRACDYLSAEFEAFVLIIHHSGKDVEKGARGSGSLRAGADVEFKIDRAGDIVSVESLKQKESEEMPPVRFRMVKCESVHGLTGEIVTSLIPVAIDVEERPRAAEKAAPSGKIEPLIMDVLRAGGSLTQGEIVARTGALKGSIYRALQSLRDKRCVMQDKEGGFWYIPQQNQ